jgi:4-hydroxyphenylacetate 3-monooxygenase
MPSRTGSQYLNRINTQRRNVWICGENVRTGIADHPVLGRMARNLAGIYDLQHRPDLHDTLTYQAPDGSRASSIYLKPTNASELRQRTKAIKCWADYSGGMFGRTADQLGVALMAYASAAEFFGQADPRFADNIRNYYAYCRDNDLLLTHTLINPQVNRSMGSTEGKAADLAARVVDETAQGLVIRGARLLATIAPVADELLVLPSTVLKVDPASAPYAFGFAIPCDSPGLKFLCREALDYGKSSFDHPLASRFDESDAIVVFDDVMVPWDRVFMHNRPDLCNQLHNGTDALAHMTLQAAVKNIAKLEFVLGTALKMAEMIGIEGFQHVQEKLAEIVVALQVARSLVASAEAEAKINQWGVLTPEMAYLFAARVWFPKIYPRMAEIIQLLGASGLIANPSEADLASAIGPDVELYLQGANVGARERIALFRLAWDMSCSGFAGRQILYERFFFGDPIRVSGALLNWLDKDPYKRKVSRFLENGPDSDLGNVFASV